MASVRSGITQATRGGKWVVSRRNFCSSGKETKGAVGEGGRISSANETKKAEDIRIDPLFGRMTPLIQILGYITISPAGAESREKYKQEKASIRGRLLVADSR